MDLADLFFIILKILPMVHSAHLDENETLFFHGHSFFCSECYSSILKDQLGIVSLSQLKNPSLLLLLFLS